jgi:hypothetical protein
VFSESIGRAIFSQRRQDAKKDIHNGGCILFLFAASAALRETTCVSPEDDFMLFRKKAELH